MEKIQLQNSARLLKGHLAAHSTEQSPEKPQMLLEEAVLIRTGSQVLHTTGATCAPSSTASFPSVARIFLPSLPLIKHLSPSSDYRRSLFC